MNSRKPAVANKVAAPYVTSHKFTPPLPLPNALRRHRLLSKILTDNHFSSVIIQGPAGHGKTTLMEQVLQELSNNGHAVGWLSLDESDNDISRFSACLGTLVRHALKQRPGDIAIESPPGVDAGTGMVENILLELERAEKSVALFIDEFQVINDPLIISLLESLLERLPPNITFYIGSRSIPELARGRLMISGRVIWMTPEELCFTWQEVFDFLHNVGLEASEAEAEAFQQRTGGWPAVLQLLQLALKGGRVSRSTLLAWASGCQNELRDYLAGNVMSYQSPDRRQFLLQTSILRRLTAPLCELLTGVVDAQPILEEFVDQGLFIRSVDPEHRWFKYHSIFSDYLVAQLERSEPGTSTALHATAADWFRRHGHHEEAIYHATRARQFELAADVIVDWIPNLIRTARLRTVERIADLLPYDLFSSRPVLLWGSAWALLFLNQLERAQQSLAELERYLAREEDDAALSRSLVVLKCAETLNRDEAFCELPGFEELAIETGDMSKQQCFEAGALANVKAINLLQQRRFAEARQMAILGESMGVRGEAAFSGAYSTSLLAYALISEGQLESALSHLQAALNGEHLKLQGSFASTSLTAVYGFALYEAGQFARAESLLRDAIDMIAQTLPVDWLISAHLALARATLLSESGDTDHREILDNGERLGLINRTPRLVSAIRLERIRLAVLDGNLHAARNLKNLLDAYPVPRLPPGWTHFSQGCDDSLVCEARLAIHGGDPTAALDMLAEPIAQCEASNHVRRQIKLLVLRALAYAELGDTDAAMAALALALEPAARGGYVATFVEEGPRCMALLVQGLESGYLDDSGPVRQFLQKLLSDAGEQIGGNRDNAPENQLVESLTRKELRILQLVVSGATNAEMADQVFVSKNTVKFHLKNIYAKLNVANRVQATSVARSMNLV